MSKKRLPERCAEDRIEIGKRLTRTVEHGHVSLIDFDLRTLIDTRLLIQANSGAGKSWAIRRILEQSHGQVQQIVLDLEGEFSTLREKFDYVLAGKGGDIAAEPKTAKLLATKLMELRVSAICDLYELKKHERVLFVRRFLESLVSTPKKLWHPVLVIVDEAHHFCPEKGQAESAPAVIDLATRGRKRGLCAVLATQRLSKLHKDACAECGNKMVGRTSLDIDQKRAADELGIMGKIERIALRNRQPGRFLVYGPALRVEDEIDTGVVDVVVGEVQTHHPKVGARQIEPAAPTARIKKVLGDLADLPTEAKQEADKLAEAKATIVELRRELRQVKKAPPPVTTPDFSSVTTKITEAEALLDEIFKGQGEFREFTANAIRDVASKVNRAGTLLAQARVATDKTAVANLSSATEPPRENHSRFHLRKPGRRPPPIVTQAIDVPRSHQRILDGLAGMEAIGHEMVHKTALAAFIGMSSNGGAFNNYLGWLRSNSLIEYQPGKMVRLTVDGRAKTQTPDEPVTLEGLHEMCLSVVANSHQRILRVLLDRHPEGMSKAELAAEVEMTEKGGAFNNYCGKLRTLGMAEYPSPGHIRASDLLFPEGLS